MRCLITGADGFLGANLAQRLLASGHEVVGAALNRKGETSLDALGIRCRVEYGDVTDALYIERLVNAYEAEWLFHLAAVSIVRIAQADPARCIRTNILGTLNVLEACRQASHVRAVVVASSDKAYGDQAGLTYTERTPLRPGAPYEVSKAAADLMAQMYGRVYGVRAMVVRAANLFGPADLNWSRLVPNSCRRALAGEAPIVHADAWTMQREWLDVTSAAELYALVAEKGRPGEAYNAGSGCRLTAGAMAERIARIAGGPLPERREKASPFAEIPCQALCSAKAHALGWWPGGERRLRAALDDTVEWYGSYLGTPVRAREAALA